MIPFDTYVRAIEAQRLSEEELRYIRQEAANMMKDKWKVPAAQMIMSLLKHIKGTQLLSNRDLATIRQSANKMMSDDNYMPAATMLLRLLNHNNIITADKKGVASK